MKSLANSQIWQNIIATDWNLDCIIKKMQDPLTFYENRPVIVSAKELKEKKLLDFNGHKMAVKLNNKEIVIKKKQIASIIDSTHAQLKKNLTEDQNDPVCQYLQAEWQRYDNLKNKNEFGFFVFYFDRVGNFESVVHFPELPIFKLALTCSGSQLYQDDEYQMSWYQTRSILNNAHVLVAGASVASLAASTLVRDGRIGYLSIGDPKGPNATNFNRTAYDCLDVANGESKAIAFARQMHRQDPTQIIYLEKNGFNEENVNIFLSGSETRKKIDVVLEAIDNIQEKIRLLKIAQRNQIPLIQIADIGSKAALSFNDSKSKSLVFGLNDNRLKKILENDFLLAAAYFLGLDNATDGELGRYLQGKKNTPFGQATPQLGSTASVAAGMCAEHVIRYLINTNSNKCFNHRRIIFDKKRIIALVQNYPSVKTLVIDLFLTLKKRFQ